MDSLKGKTILIGKDATHGYLLVALKGNPKSVAVGGMGSVPGSVSRLKPNEGTAHCKIEIDPSGGMLLTNMRPGNVTFVNDFQIQSKKIDSSCTISLGKDKYPLDLDLILHAAIKLVVETTPPPSSKTYSIKHLEKVWNNYEEAVEAIQCKQQKLGRRRMLPIMIGSVSALISPIVASMNKNTLWVTVPIAAASFLIYLLNYTQKDTTIEEKKSVTNSLYDDYICPNPLCHHFMGNQPYKILKQNKKCPYCGCKFSED